MGISGKPEALIDVPYARRAGFEVIKRFTGGGTVVVDSNTLFVTLIGDADAFGLDPWPRSIMSWTEGLYRPVLGKDDFRLVENDYCIGSRKVGGNAQAVSRGRFVHHTSFLWDFDPDNMRSLLLPSKRPDYRGDRSHGDFLCTLRGRFDDPVQFEDAIVSQVEAVVGSVESVTVEEVKFCAARALALHAASPPSIHVLTRACVPGPPGRRSVGA